MFFSYVVLIYWAEELKIQSILVFVGDLRILFVTPRSKKFFHVFLVHILEPKVEFAAGDALQGYILLSND